MTRTLLLLVAALLCGCGSTTEEGESSSPAPAVAVVAAGDLPSGTIHRTSRKADFDAICKELTKADVVYFGESHGNAAHHALELQILRQLRASTRLDAIGLAAVARPAQPALDDYARGRIDWAQLTAQLEGTAQLEPYRSILEFARKHRLGLVALDVAPDVLALVEKQGREALTAEQRRDLPAQSDSVAGYEEFLAAQAGPHAWRLRDEVLADSVVRWMRESPRGAQIAVLAVRDRIAQPWGMPGRVRTRGGRTHASVVLLDGPASPSQLARSYADYVFVPGE